MKLFTIIVICPTLIFAQKSAFFETTIWLQDSFGHRDSVIIGHDIEANGFYNPQFGESDISIPWDSVFEVRAAHFLSWNQMNDDLILSKKIVSANEKGYHPKFDCLWFNEAVVLFVNVVHFPITVFWDRQAFNESYCRNRSTLTPSILPIISEDWYESLVEDTDYACLAERDSFVISSFNYKSFDFFWIDSVEGGILDTMIAFLVFPRDQIAFDSPCTSTVSASSVSQNPEIILCPNPASNYINIQNEIALKWTLFSLNGQIIKYGCGELIDLSTVENGMYFVHIFNEKGNITYAGKIAKH